MKHNVINRVLMCEPLYFSSLNYSINPWMKPGEIDQKKALDQWSNLVAIYKTLGIKVEIIKQKKNVPDMVFATDQGLVHDGKVLLSNFRHEQRRSESKFYKRW